MIELSVKKVLELHNKMIHTTGGSNGVRELSLIESSINQIKQTFDSIELYPTTEEKAAMLAYSLISNHGFVDGNKRIGIYVMLVFLELNKLRLRFTQNELIDLGLNTASGKYKYDYILEFINKHKG